MLAKVDLNLLASPGPMTLVSVNGVDLARMVSSIDVHADPRHVPTITLKIMGPHLIKADADVRLLLGAFGMRRLLERYNARHADDCDRSNGGCACGLTDFLSAECAPLQLSTTAQPDEPGVLPPPRSGVGDLKAKIVVDTKALAEELGRRIPEWLADHARRNGRL